MYIQFITMCTPPSRFGPPTTTPLPRAVVVATTTRLSTLVVVVTPTRLSTLVAARGAVATVAGLSTPVAVPTLVVPPQPYPGSGHYH